VNEVQVDEEQVFLLMPQRQLRHDFVQAIHSACHPSSRVKRQEKDQDKLRPAGEDRVE
jgi:hypothetical protein